MDDLGTKVDQLKNDPVGRNLRDIIEAEVQRRVRAYKIPASVFVYFPKTYITESQDKVEITIDIELEIKE